MKRQFICLFLLILAISVSETAFSQEASTKNNFTSQSALPSPGLESVSNITRQISAMEDPKIAGLSLAQIADLVWEKDEEFARGLFVGSMNKLAVEEKDSPKEISSKNSAYRKVLSLIAKRDSNWAKALIKEFAKEAGRRARTNLEIADSLLESDPKLASDFANQSVQIEITEGLLWFLKNLKQKDQTEANRLFLNILERYPQQANVDANQYAILGTYLFTSPNSNPQDHQTISLTRVGNIIVPNLTVNLPNIPANLVREYIRNAVVVINRPTNDIRQRQLKYALGYLLLPKAQEFAPNLIGELGGAIAALASFVPAEILSEDAYSNVKKKVSGSLSERIEEIEKLPDSYNRDRLFLDVAFQAWRQKDFAVARIAAAKIENNEARSKLETLIQFGEASNLLKDKQTNLFDVMRITEKLPVSLEKSLLWIGIASVAQKAKQTSLAADALDSALKDAARLDDKNTPFLMLYVSGQTAKGDAFQSSAVLNEAIKSFNKSETIEKPSLNRKITLEPLTLTFPLALEGVNLDFQDSFQKAINGNEENGLQIVEGLKDEQLKSQAFVVLVKLILERETKNIEAEAQEAVKVGEDGIRKSAVKTVMPVYPKESLKKQAKGVGVVEVQYNENGEVNEVKLLESPDAHTGKAVVDAVKQWKFNPSKSRGKPVSIRGKITFYFVINENGKGEVKNPKQFQ